MIILMILIKLLKLDLRIIRILRLLRYRVKKLLIFKKYFNLTIERRLEKSFNRSLIFSIEKTSGSFRSGFRLLFGEDIFMKILSDSCE